MHNASQAAHVGRLIKAISPTRLQPFYLSVGEPDLEALARYSWNAALCEAFYPLLHALEIVLRNSMDDAIRSAYPGVRFYTVKSWLDANPSLLEPIYGQKAVSEAKRKLASRNPSRVILAGQLVAELDFGFWTGLLNNYYLFQSAKDPRFWPRLLPAVFPHMSPQPTHPSIPRKRFEDIRKFRNRVFHHEPIWKRPNLVLEREEIIEAISWMSPEAAKTVSLLDRVRDVLSDRGRRRTRVLVYQATSPSRAPYKNGKLKVHLGCA